MKVTVDPQRPIPGILIKNKWISEKTTLDLNRNEILRCMQYGTVYDEYGNVIDMNNLNNIELHNHIKSIQKSIKETTTVEENSINNIKESDLINESLLYDNKDKKEHIDIKEDLKPDYSLSIISCSKQDDYIQLEVQFNTSVGTIGGNMYGLFTTIGNRPSILEYKSNEEWIKFNNKFRNFSTINNNDKFIFRLIPRNNSSIKYKVCIKESNNVLAETNGLIDVSKII